MDRVRRGAVALAAASVAVGAAGCGIEDRLRYPYAKESAETIFLDAMQAMTEVESVRLSGSQDAKGEPAFTFNLMSNGDDLCGGQLAVASSEFDVVLSPEGDFFKGSALSWDQFPGQSKAKVGRAWDGRWVKLPRDSRLGGSVLCSLVDEMLTPEEEKAVDARRVPDGLQLTHKGLTEASGEKVVEIHAADDKGAADVFVSLEEPHHVVKLSMKDRKRRTTVVFSDFGFPADISVPKGKDVVDVTGR